MGNEGKMQVREVVRPGAISARRGAMILAVFVVLALLALSFHGALDEFAHEQVAATTNESIAIFALTRGINAVISMFQSLELSFVASIQIGEMLDPVNDAIERLSSAMAWAIGSLFLQDIVLKIASSPVFKWVFLALGLAAISALLLPGWRRTRDPSSRALALPEAGLDVDGLRVLMVRIFVIAAFIRFIVPLFVSIGFLLSQMILDPEIGKNRESLSSFSDQIAIETTADSVDDLLERKTHEESELKGFEESLESLGRELESIGDELEGLKEEIDRIESDLGSTIVEKLEKGVDKIRPGLGGWLSEKIGDSSPETPETAPAPSKEELELALASAKKELAAATKRREEVEREMVRLQTRIEEGEEKIECIDRQLVGESCDSFLEKFSADKMADKIWEVVEMAGDAVEALTMLLAAVIVKNIVIPLVFLMIALKASLPMIRYCLRLVPDMRQEVGSLRNLPERTDRGA